MDLVVVMPAYNEAGCIAESVRSWASLFKTVSGRLVVVNDGSKDQTGAILDRLALEIPQLTVIHQKNAGHGSAVLRGYHEALQFGPDFVFQTDSDNQFFVDDFWKLWEMRKHTNLVLGFRLIRKDALHRLVITRFVRWVMFGLFGEKIRDANVPFRLFTGPFLAQALTKVPHGVFAPNLFLSLLGARSGNDLCHVPVQHRDRATGKVSIVRLNLIRACFRCVRELRQFRRELQSVPRVERRRAA